MFQFRHLSLSDNRLARKLLLLLLPVLLVAQYIDTHAQTAKLPRVGVATTLSPGRPPLPGLRHGLAAAGYVDGKNFSLTVTHRTVLFELMSVVRKFVEDQVDVIVTIGSRDTRIAQQVSQKTPIVFLAVDDPIGRGFVKSYARPNTNLTGLSRFYDIDDNGKLLELVKEMIPTLKSVTVISDGRVTDRFSADQARSIRKVAKHQGIQFDEKHARSEKEIFRIISAISSGPERGVLLNCTALFANLKRSASLAKEKRIPLQGCSPRHVIQDGALFDMPRN